MNCLALEADGEILVVDCGVTFPRSDLGIDTFHPDLSWLEERADRVRGLVLTHGHEDHIGAVPYFADRFEVPIWGPKYALELVRMRLAEFGYRDGEVDLRASKPRGRFSVGGFDVEAIRVTHSIADATALAIRTPAGLVVHTGDFKLDDEPGDGELTDEARFAELGDEGVRLLLSDSTNVDSHGKTGSEALSAEVLSRIIDSSPYRVVIGMFASNVQRMGAIANLARKHKRKLVLLGRSMQTHSRVARDQKRLDWPSDLVVSLDEARSMKRRDVLVLATGTQGEKMAALWRLSTREHPAFMLDAGDKVIFSCRVIPGNDPTVVSMTNGFLRQGIQVHTPITNPGVHVSGHAYRDEQRRMIDLVRPTGFVPVHGTLHHLHRHAELAREQGVNDTLVLENGEIGEVAPTAMKKAKDTAKHAKIPTWNGEEIPLSVLSDRETIARAGIAFVTVLVDGQGRPVGPTTVTTRGVIDEKADAEVLRSAARAAHEALTARPGRGPARDDEIAEIARLAARKQLELAVGKKPLVLTNVVRVKA